MADEAIPPQLQCPQNWHPTPYRGDPNRHGGPHSFWMDYPANFNMNRTKRWFRKLFQNSRKEWMIPLLWAGDVQPLYFWGKQVRLGIIRRARDNQFRDEVALKIKSLDYKTTFITCPEHPGQTLGIWLPILVIHLKNLGMPFQFMVAIRDEFNGIHRIHFNTESKVIARRRTYLDMEVGIALEEGWNELVVDLAKYTRKLYNLTFMECVRLEIYANCRLRCVYFTSEVNYEASDNLARTASATGCGGSIHALFVEYITGIPRARPWDKMPIFPELDDNMKELWERPYLKERCNKNWPPRRGLSSSHVE